MLLVCLPRLLFVLNAEFVYCAATALYEGLYYYPPPICAGTGKEPEALKGTMLGLLWPRERARCAYELAVLLPPDD